MDNYEKISVYDNPQLINNRMMLLYSIKTDRYNRHWLYVNRYYFDRSIVVYSWEM